jgi:hypothetical protein
MGAALSRDSIRSRVETSNVRTNGWRGRRRAGERDDGEAVRARDEARRRARACACVVVVVVGRSVGRSVARVRDGGDGEDVGARVDGAGDDDDDDGARPGDDDDDDE